MPKKKEVITKLGEYDKLTVQKSLPLFSLWKSDLSLTEFKILDTYLARINSHKPEKRAIVFEKGELEEKLGVSRINQGDLETRLKHLMGSVVKVEDGEEKKGFRMVTLFEEAVAEQDDDGLWEIRLECTQKAMKYFFNVDNLGYLRYKLRCITSIKSRYSYVMFLYLEANRYRKEWEISVDELKTILNCENEPTYETYKRFNDLILKKVYKELHEKTELRYEYQPIRKGRAVKTIHFAVETLEKPVFAEADMTKMLVEQSHGRDEICHGFSVSEFEVFTDEQLAYLKDIAWPKKRDADVARYNAELDDLALSCEFATADYLRQAIMIANMRKPKNLFQYVKKVVENDNY